METQTQNPSATHTASPAPQRVFFYKEIFSNVYIVNGKKVDFEQLDGNQGVLVLEVGRDSDLISALNDAARRQIGGIVKISEAEYAQKKTDHPSAPFDPRSGKDMLRVMQPVTPFGPRDPVAADKQPAAHVPKPPTPFAQPEAQKPAALTPEQIAAQTSGEVQLPMKEKEGFKPATRRLSTKPPEEVTSQ